MPTDDQTSPKTPNVLPAALDRWMAKLAPELGLPEGETFDLNLLLDVARDAAHGVARPSAPLTTFLVGYAAGLSGGGADEIARLSEIASRLAIEQRAAHGGDA